MRLKARNNLWASCVTSIVRQPGLVNRENLVVSRRRALDGIFKPHDVVAVRTMKAIAP